MVSLLTFGDYQHTSRFVGPLRPIMKLIWNRSAPSRRRDEAKAKISLAPFGDCGLRKKAKFPKEKVHKSYFGYYQPSQRFHNDRSGFGQKPATFVPSNTQASTVGPVNHHKARGKRSARRRCLYHAATIECQNGSIAWTTIYAKAATTTITADRLILSPSWALRMNGFSFGRFCFARVTFTR